MERSDFWLRSFRGLSATAISDALDALGIQGAMLGIGPLAPGLPRMVGYARTILQGPRPEIVHPDISYTRHGSLVADGIGADDVVVISMVGGIVSSSWGALLTHRARIRGAAGAVIDGPIRDPTEIAELRFPVFRQPIFCPAGTKARLATLGIDIPIPCGGVQVSPGDIVIGDDNGVVVVPTSHAADVIVAAERIVAREEELVRGFVAGWCATR